MDAMTVVYGKRYLLLTEQLDLLKARGLECGPDEIALQHLHDFSYYTLSAYWYPFRRPLPPDERPETQKQYRSSEFMPGASLDDAVALALFDRKLRSVLFEGLARLELALRFQISYVAGSRSPFAHVLKEHLDSKACHQKTRRGSEGSESKDLYSVWLEALDRQVERSRSEDFIQHFYAKYNSKLPIWIAVEVLDLGALIRLFKLLNAEDRSRISSSFGVSNGIVFHSILYGLGILRNHVAHHNRVWNRQLSASLPRLGTGLVGEPLAHLKKLGEPRKLYPWVAMLAYVLKEYDPSTNWHRTMGTQLKKVPESPLTKGAEEMGAPVGWTELDLWRSEPTGKRLTVQS